MRVTRDMIDPQLRFMGSVLKLLNRNLTEERMRKSAGRPSLMLKIIGAMFKPKGVRIEEEWIPRVDGSQLRILILRPLEPKRNVPGLLWLHGGGYYTGSPELEGLASKDYIDMSHCVVVSPDYRLSVEAPYPAALEDCYTALQWLKDNANHLGVRDDQIAVAGGSAGGGLTAALTLYARDKGEINIAFQMPTCPMIDDRMETESARDNNAPGWDSIANASGWKIYLGDRFETDDVPPYAAPARATDYTKLPPTYSHVGSLDPFRDETITYVENLRASGVPVDFEIYEGCYHGFELFTKADVTKRLVRRRNDWFKKAVREYFAPQPEKDALVR